jgi:hypothetical protein
MVLVAPSHYLAVLRQVVQVDWAHTAFPAQQAAILRHLLVQTPVVVAVVRAHSK